MTALQKALDLLTPGGVLERLAAYLGKPAPHFDGSPQDGMCADFRPGCEEENPSLSYRVGNGGPVFKRFGGDGFQGGAVDLLESVGLAKDEAVALLLDWAGVPDEAPKPGERKAGNFTPTKAQAAGLEKAGRALAKLHPLAPEKHASALRGFVRVEAGEDSPEALEVARRGLTLALQSGALVAYRWVGQWGPEGGPYKTRTLPAHILPGALAFDVYGPDGTVWATKARNPGTKEDLKQVNAQRYVYVTAGQSTPAQVRRIAAKEEGQAVRFLIVEGELNAVACFVMLEAAGADGWEVQGVASAVALPHVAHLPAGAQVYVWADPDEEGEKARETWGALLASKGCRVFQLGREVHGDGSETDPHRAVKVNPFKTPEKGEESDACDMLGSALYGPEVGPLLSGRRLEDAIKKARPWQPKAAKKEGQRDGQPEEGQGEAGDVWETKRRGYGERDGKLCALTMKKSEEEGGEDYESAEVLADFTARIVAEVLEDDGSGEPRRVFHIEGRRPDGAPLFPPLVEVPTADFSGMNWAVAKWGGAARIPSGQGKKDKARDGIQVLSNAAGYPFRTVYQHTGWIQHPQHGPLYLTAGAVIGAAGGVEGLAVSLPGRLAAYALPDPAKADAEAVRQAVRASLDLLALAPDAVAVPTLGAVYRSVLGPSDFVVWTVGETGKHKTAFNGLAMSHFGQRWGRKFLPDGWNSSANFLEVNAFRVKDAAFMVDDFKPSGSGPDRAKMDATASRLIQGAADGAGRGTLTADRRSRAGLWPRGLVMTTAEDLPRGHSNRARLMVVEVHSRLIDGPAKSAAFFNAEEKGVTGVYALALAAYVQALAGTFDSVRVGGAAHLSHVRALSPYFQGAHGRTGDAAAEVAYGWQTFLSFAVGVGAVDEAEAGRLWTRVVAALKDTAQGQAAHLAEADPVGRAVGILSELLAQGRVYLADVKTGGQPEESDAAAAGWQVHRYKGPDGEEESYRTKPGADLLGYVSEEAGQVWGHFLPEALHKTLQDVARGQGGAALPDPSKLWGNMRDKLHGAGLMRCEVEAGRVRATAKKKDPSGVRRHFITLALPLEGVCEYLGTLGTLGTLSNLSPSSTSSNSVPTLSISLLGLGTLGTLDESPSSFSPEVQEVEVVEEVEEWTAKV